MTFSPKLISWVRWRACLSERVECSLLTYFWKCYCIKDFRTITLINSWGIYFLRVQKKKRSYKFPFIFWMAPWSLGKKIILAFINFHTPRSFFLNSFKVLQLSTLLEIWWVIIKHCTLRRWKLNNFFVVRIFRGQKCLYSLIVQGVKVDKIKLVF